MTNAGYPTSQWKLLVQTYSSPIPNGSGFRYSQSGFTRQTIGGCGVWNRDADWANDTVVATFNNTVAQRGRGSGLANMKILDMTNALVGRRLCENTVGLLEEKGVASWTVRRRGRQDRVGQPDPDRDGDLPPVPDPGGRPPELLGPARAAQLPAAGVLRRAGRRARR